MSEPGIREHAPYNPVDHQQRPRPHADLLAPIHTAPRIHRRQTTHEAEPTQIKHRCVPNVRKRAEVVVPERRCDRLVTLVHRKAVLLEHGPTLGDLGQLLSKVLALL